MSNFAFIKAEWPAIHADCARAESYLSADPRSACFYGRRAAEVLVAHLYDVMALSLPYQDDLSARVNDAGFKAKVGVGISQKLNLIRKVGNTAVHDTKPIRPDVALAVLRELHHVVVWAAFRYSTNPSAVPTQSLFDPALAAKASPLSHAVIRQRRCAHLLSDLRGRCVNDPPFFRERSSGVWRHSSHRGQIRTSATGRFQSLHRE